MKQNPYIFIDDNGEKKQISYLLLIYLISFNKSCENFKSHFIKDLADLVFENCFCIDKVDKIEINMNDILMSINKFKITKCQGNTFISNVVI